MTLHHSFFFILTIAIYSLLLLSTCSACAKYYSCETCLQDPSCGWCGLDFACINRTQSAECATRKVTYLLSNSTHAEYPFNWQNPFTCDTGRPYADEISQCTRPIFISVNAENTYSFNYVNSFPKMIVLTVTYNQSMIPLPYYSLTKYKVVPGLYFVEYKSTEKQPSFFSLRTHVLYNTPAKLFFNPYRIVEPSASTYSLYIDDVRILGAPGTYKIGYAVAMRDNQGKYHCGYIKSTTKLVHQSQTQFILSDAGLWLQFPIFALAVFLTGLFIWCCPHKLHNPDDIQQRLDDISSVPEKTPVAKEKLKFTKRCSKTCTNCLSNFVTNMKDFFYYLPSFRDIEIKKRCGTDAYIFQKFNWYIQAMTLIMVCISMVIFILDLSSKDFNFFQDFAASTDAAIKWNNPMISLQAVGLLLFGFLFCALRLVLHALGRTKFNEEPTSAEVDVIQVSNMPTSIVDHDKFKLHFMELMESHKSGKLKGSDVVSANIVLKLPELHAALKEKKKIKQTIGKIRQMNQTSSFCWAWACCCTQLKYLQYRLARVNKKIDKLKNKKVRGTGYGFVTFSSREAAKFALDSYSTMFRPKTSVSAQIKHDRWKLKRATAAEDYIWDNLHYSKFTRVVRYIFGNLAFVLVLCIVNIFTFLGSIIWFSREFFKHETNAYISKISADQTDLTVFNWILDQIPAVIAITNEIIPPILEVIVFKIEKHVSKVSQRVNFTRRIMFHMFLNTIILPHIVKWTGYNLLFFTSAEPEFQSYHYFYNTFGVEVIRFVMAQLLLGKSLELGVLCLRLLIQLITFGKIERPQYGFEGNYGFRITLLLLLLYYGIHIPVLPMFVSVYLFIMFLLDRWLMMYLFKPVKGGDPRFIIPIERNVMYYMMIWPAIQVVLCIAYWHYFTAFAGIAYILLIIAAVIIYILERKFKNKPRYISLENQHAAVKTESQTPRASLKVSAAERKDAVDVLGILPTRESASLDSAQLQKIFEQAKAQSKRYIPKTQIEYYKKPKPPVEPPLL